MIPCAMFLYIHMMSVSGLVQVEPPMAYHRTFGPAVDAITRLGWGLGIISLLVIIIIAGLLLGGIFRKRGVDPAADPRQLTVRRDAGGMGWIYIGVGTSSVVLFGCMIWTLIVTAAVAHPPVAPALTVQVTASQWWWSLRYVDDRPAQIFTTANEIHIPVGQPIRFELMSADVMHAFWIPQLAGKMDVIPGQTNVTWLEADQPGEYLGQCAAFCGPQHAHMALMIVAETPEDFTAWKHSQLADTAPPNSEEALRGAQIFQTRCAVCHTIRGVSPAGVVGPDLSHLMARHTLAAGLLPNTPGNLAGWIDNPQGLKPGTRMPDPNLSGTELTAVTSYLNTLQ